MSGRLAVPIGVALSLFVLLAGTPVLAQSDGPPQAIAAFETEAVAPGVWRVVDDGTKLPSERATDVRVGADGGVWLLSPDGASELGVEGAGPPGVPVDRILGVGADGEAWLRFEAFDQQGIGTWDGQAWTVLTPERRASALEADSTRAPGVIRDVAFGPDGSVWVVAGEQDSPRWERFTVERLDEGGWTTWALGEGLPGLVCGKNCGDRSRVVALDDGTVWVSVDQGGLMRFDGSTWEAVRPLGGDSDRPVVTLDGGPEGTLWADVLTTAGERVRVRFDGREWSAPEHAQPPDGGRSDGPLAVAPDGTLWTAGNEPSGPALWAIDRDGRRRVSALERCPIVDPDRTDVCIDALSASVGPDGLLWVIAEIDVSTWAEGGAALLVVDPASALEG